MGLDILYPILLNPNILEVKKKTQNDHKVLEEWIEKKRMKFNKDKCKILYLGDKNQMYKNRIREHLAQ